MTVKAELEFADHLYLTKWTFSNSHSNTKYSSDIVHNRWIPCTCTQRTVDETSDACEVHRVFVGYFDRHVTRPLHPSVTWVAICK